MNTRKNTSVSARINNLRDLLIIHLAIIGVLWCDRQSQPTEEKEAIYQSNRERLDEEQCHLHQQKKEYMEEHDERLLRLRAFKEHLKAFENHRLQSGEAGVAKMRTDKISRAKVSEVGYGVTQAEVDEAKRLGFLPANATLPKSLTKEEADHWFETVTFPTYSKCVEEVCDLDLSVEQRFALVSFCHNLGSKTLKKLLERKPEDISAAMKLYCFAGKKKRDGLVKRRAWEAEMWESGLKKPTTLASR